jgi:ribosomal protein L10
MKVRMEPDNFSALKSAMQGASNDITSTLGKVKTFNAGLKELQTTGRSSGNAFQNVTTQLQQVDKSTTSVASKMKNFAGTFAGSITSVGALGGQVFNLSRQYQDLSDTQIRVDRTALKMSKTAEAERAARAKLQALIAKGVRSGKEYEQAVLDVKQAEEAATLATTLHGEALEDQQRAYEDFALNLLPTVVTGISSVINIVKELAGPKGFGGLKDSIVSAGNALTGGAGFGGGGFLGKLKSGGGAGGGGLLGFLKSIGGTGTIAAGGATLAAGAAPPLIGIAAIMKAAESAEIMKKSGLFADPTKDYDKNLKQQEIILNALHKSYGEWFVDTQGVIDQYKALNPKLDENGQILTTLPAKIDKVAQATKAATAAITPYTFANDPKLMGMAGQYAKALSQTGGNAWTAINQQVQKSGLSAAQQTFVLREAWGQYEKQMKAASIATAEAANKIQYLDKNLQPVPIIVNDLNNALKNAQTNLAASGSGLSNWQIGVNNATASVEEFKKQAEQTRAGMDVWRNTLTQDIFAKTGFKASTAFTIDQLKQLYEAALQGPQAFDAYLKSLKETNKALWETGKAAQVAYGALVPGNKKIGIPKGGRSGQLRIRSDYVQPLIGSPEAQLQMIMGNRPKVFARGSAELAKIASEIKIGDKMNQQGDKYAQGVGKMTQANNNLKTSLGNMPASLIPATQATQKQTAASIAMSKAMANIPKQVAPKVTATVTGAPAVAAITKALKNIPRNVTSTVHVNTVQHGLSIGGSTGSKRVAKGQTEFHAQHGYLGTVKRPSLFMVGEGGRHEDVMIRPRGSAGGGFGNMRGGGGRAGTLKIEIVPQEFNRMLKASMTWGDDSFK